MQLQHIVCNSTNPWPMDKCKQSQCFPCQTDGSKKKCRKEGITYQIVCKRCQQDGKGEAVYIGESGRYCTSREDEHKRDFNSKTREKPLADHEGSAHKDDDLTIND